MFPRVGAHLFNPLALCFLFDLRLTGRLQQRASRAFFPRIQTQRDIACPAPGRSSGSLMTALAHYVSQLTDRGTDK